MANKRPSVKGKGADIFLSGDSKAPSSHKLKGEQERKKATFYIPQDIVDALDDAWLDMRRIKRDVTKSELVTVALERALSDYADKGKQSHLQQEVLGEDAGAHEE